MRKNDSKGWMRFGCGILLVLNGFLAAGYYFYHVAIKRNKKDFLLQSKDLKQNFELNKEKDTSLGNEDIEADAAITPSWLEAKGFETWTTIAEDGLKLVGYYISAGIPTDRVVILAHGYTSQGKDMESFVKYYHEQLGYNVLIPDARGHGNSEGHYIGFGWHERKDYLLWVGRVIGYIGKDAKIVLHGISMGAATVMMASGEELPVQVAAIIEDCGYTSVDEELAYQLKRMYHLPPFPILSFTSVITNFKAGYRFSEASALKQVKKNKLPMLFIHGGADTFVPTQMVHKLYESCKAPKDMLIVEGAGHGLASAVDPEAYYGKVAAFLEQYMR